MGPERAVARLQLEAQIQYRRGNNKDAIQLYSQLFQQHKVLLPPILGRASFWLVGRLFEAILAAI